MLKKRIVAKVINEGCDCNNEYSGSQQRKNVFLKKKLNGKITRVVEENVRLTRPANMHPKLQRSRE